MIPKVLAAARKFLALGYMVIPIVPRTKRPALSNWTERRITEEQVETYFQPDGSIGLVLGQAGGGLTDVDLDCLEASKIAQRLLPPTSMVHGRLSKPRSHHWYICNPCPEYRKFADLDGKCLLELRADGHQTVVPPSMHPSGEPLVWHNEGPPAVVTAFSLQRAAATTAAVCLLARHWRKEGSRNDAFMALSGTLLVNLDWDVEEAEKFIGALAEATNDEEQQSRIKTVSSTKEKLDSGEPITGLPKLEELIGAGVVERALQWLGDDEAVEVIETDVGEQNPWPEPLGMDASYGIVGEIVAKLEPHTEADPAALYLQTLVAFGNLIGRNVYLPVEGDKHYTNLFCVIVGISSKGRKGTSLGHVRRILVEVEPEWGKHLPTGLSSGEGLIWAVRDPIWTKKAVRQGGRLLEDQDVLSDPGIKDKRCLVNEQEFVSVLEVMRRETNTLSAVLRDAWDRGDLRSMTKNSAASATGAHISIIAHITRDELLQRLDLIAITNGFANRFLWGVVRRSKFLPFGGNARRINFDPIVKRLKKIKEFCSSSIEVSWSADAAKEWDNIYRDISRERQGAIGAVTSRAEAQVGRLATLYAVLDCSDQIKLPHLKAALEIWRFCEQSAVYIFGNTTGNRIADNVIKELRCRPDGMRRTEISYFLNHNPHSREISAALSILASQGLAVCVKKKKATGRPEERWFAKEHWPPKKETKETK